ncbi:phage baseplate assembly protein V [Paucimonas lemoignei]|uniref:Phage baseplate assembly protein V n=1 Tax=Paucimonas lemoignei TaxID=29443 RepID=A0A4R3HWG0_PAULE|nr:phage baseplate assembly protein V [Paucimonas lemoignei]TCS37492.1 phage baseplate assembly protein V [Paucimonas lemoignei]
MFDAIDKLTAGARNKAALMVGRCILKAIGDGKAVQLVQAQLLAEEIHDDVERIQEYGFTSVPKPGAEGVIVFVGGNRDHGLLIAVEDRRFRLKALESGEVAIYDDQGQKVHLTRTGIVIDGAGKDVTIVNAPVVHVPQDLQVGRDIIAGRDIKDAGGTKSMAGMRGTYNAHTHNDPQGGTVNTPNQGM